MERNKLVAPVLKWAGGKRQLLGDFAELLPRKINSYCEPFIGGGALLFHLQPSKAFVNDVCSLPRLSSMMLIKILFAFTL